MSAEWQVVIVGLAVAASAAALLWRAYRALRGGGGTCGGCSGCPAAAPAERALLSIEPGPPSQHPSSPRSLERAAASGQASR